MYEEAGLDCEGMDGHKNFYKILKTAHTTFSLSYNRPCVTPILQRRRFPFQLLHCSFPTSNSHPIPSTASLILLRVLSSPG